MAIAPVLVPPHDALVGSDPAGPLVIDTDHCKGCELCIAACPRGVLSLDVTVVNRLGYHPVRLTDPGGCTSCVICARVCPDAVFTVLMRPKEA